MTELTISTIVIVLLIVPFLVHRIEVLWPMQSCWVVNWVLPFFAPMLHAEQIAMLDAALDAAPTEKKRAKPPRSSLTSPCPCPW